MEALAADQVAVEMAETPTTLPEELAQLIPVVAVEAVVTALKEALVVLG